MVLNRFWASIPCEGCKKDAYWAVYMQILFFVVDFNKKSGFKIEKNLLFCKAIKKPEHTVNTCMFIHFSKIFFY